MDRLYYQLDEFYESFKYNILKPMVRLKLTNVQ